MPVKLDSLTADYTFGLNVNGAKNVSGLQNGLGGQNQDSVKYSYTSTKANAAALGSDETYFILLSIAASGNAVINLQSFVDLAGQTASLARLKAWRIRLLAADQAAPDGTVGTGCSSIAVGNAASNGNALSLDAATDTYTIKNGGCWQHADYTAAGIAVDATHLNVKILNNDAVNAAKVLVSLTGGSD